MKRRKMANMKWADLATLAGHRDIEAAIASSNETHDNAVIAKEKGKEAEDKRRHARDSSVKKCDTVVLKD